MNVTAAVAGRKYMCAEQYVYFGQYVPREECLDRVLKFGGTQTFFQMSVGPYIILRFFVL